MPIDLSDAMVARLSAAVECSPSGLLMTDRQGAVVLANREIERLFGYDRHELLGQPVEMLMPARFQSGHARQRETYARDPDRRVMGSGRDLLGLRKDGTEIPLEIGLTPVETPEGAFVLASVVDITARRTAEDNLLKLEAQLRQAQKMEAVGTLAGGIAHDFNNILGVILGFVDVLHGSITDPVSLNDLSEIERATLRGRDLVNRIVSFARHAEPELRAVDLAEALKQAAKLLRVILPPQVEFRVSIAEGTPHIKADLTCLHQVIINLGTNAIQAMPGGGLLELGVEPLYVRDHAARSHPNLREGWYAHLFVRDSGIGMAPATQARIFEPFFTTKPAGSGTGLGLAMVQGIMKDHDGACLVESALGHGTRVRCLFPAVERSAVETPRAVHAVTLGSGEHVLLLDDEPELRDIGVRRLLRLGYQATGCTSAEEALRLIREAATPFDVVITDYSMPTVNGLQFARMVTEALPGTPVLLMSGFNELPVLELAAYGVRRVLQKPMTTPELSAALHDAITRADGAA